MKKILLLISVLSVAGLAFGQGHARADYPGMVARSPQALPPTITKRETLRATYSDTLSSTLFASCGSAGCEATPVNIFTHSLVCPAVAGAHCTYDIQEAGQVESGGNSIFSGEDGLYQFFVDGAIPNGGGTDGNGFYAFQLGGPEFLFGTSYNVHSTVTNTIANQQHTITVNLSCFDLLGDSAGCFGESGFQTLVVRVWTP